MESIRESLGNDMTLPQMSPPVTRIRVSVNPPESSDSRQPFESAVTSYGSHRQRFPVGLSLYRRHLTLTGLGLYYAADVLSQKRFSQHAGCCFKHDSGCANRLLQKAPTHCPRISVKRMKYWLDPSRFTFRPPVGHLAYGVLRCGFKDKVER